MENIEKWSTDNKMYINTEKTKALLVTGKRLQHKLSEETATLKLRLDATNIDHITVTCLPSLNNGVTLPYHLLAVCDPLTDFPTIFIYFNKTLWERIFGRSRTTGMIL